MRLRGSKFSNNESSREEDFGGEILTQNSLILDVIRVTNLLVLGVIRVSLLILGDIKVTNLQIFGCYTAQNLLIVDVIQLQIC